MKRCPKCSRTFPDESQKFCTVDGGLLISDPVFDPNVTIRATAADVARHLIAAGRCCHQPRTPQSQCDHCQHGECTDSGLSPHHRTDRDNHR